MAFQSEFENNQKLKDCAINDIDHVGENFSPTGPHVGLIQKALNAWAAKQTPPIKQITGREAAPPFTFGSDTGDLVATYKRRQTQPILNFKGQIDRIVGKKTVIALDKELPSNGGGSTINSDMALVNAADIRRIGALMKAEQEIRRLKQAFEPNVPDENERVVKAFQRQLFVPLDGNFWNTVNQVLSMIITNRLSRSHFQIDKSSTDFAFVQGDLDQGKGITIGDSFFNTNDNCRQEVITHEFFHFIVGVQHFYSATTNAEAMKCPHHLARFVFDAAIGQQLAPCSGSDSLCR